MADTEARVQSHAAQNTGNPVLDSVVNIIAAKHFIPTTSSIEELHKAVLAIAEKEPGGLSRPNAPKQTKPRKDLGELADASNRAAPK